MEGQLRKAAHLLHRLHLPSGELYSVRWIGIDITHLSITLTKKRLRDAFGEEVGQQYQVVGESRRAGIAARCGASGRACPVSVSGVRQALG